MDKIGTLVETEVELKKDGLYIILKFMVDEYIMEVEYNSYNAKEWEFLKKILTGRKEGLKDAPVRLFIEGNTLKKWEFLIT